MDSLTQTLITSGISKETLQLLLMLPFISTLVVIARHIMGIKSFGMYFPIIATYALVFLGFKMGILLVIYLAIIGIFSRMIISKLRIHYLSRLSLVICISTIASLALLYFMTLFDFSRPYIAQNALPIILVISFCETFVSTQIQKGFRTGIYLFVETLFISIIGYLIISSAWARDFVLQFPYIILLTLVLNYLIGKWKGLRLYEVWRFRTIKSDKKQ
jgi:hypothetical protein